MVNVDMAGLARLSVAYNQRFSDFVIDRNHVSIKSVTSLSGGRAVVAYTCRSLSGRIFERTTTILRYSLWEVLSPRLPREEIGFRLYAVDKTITEILVSLRQQTGVYLTGEDVYIESVSGNYVQLVCRASSVGWYGAIALYVTHP